MEQSTSFQQELLDEVMSKECRDGCDIADEIVVVVVIVAVGKRRRDDLLKDR